MMWRWNSTYSRVAKDSLPPASRQRLRCSSTRRSTAWSSRAPSCQTKKRSARPSAALRRALFRRDRRSAQAHAEHADRLEVEREDADRLAILERDDNAQRLVAAVDLPPLVLPDPGVEDASRCGLLVQAIPFRRELREVRGRGEELHRNL